MEWFHTNIDIFGDLGSGEFKASNSRQFLNFFGGTPKFFFWKLPM